jgi:pimeloyl-ACP methyl ester carboxylesterase
MERHSGNYAMVNGLNMYYEIHGNGFPLVLLHGGGSTISTTFGSILPVLVKTNKIIAVELQAHGHTRDINRPLTFEQDADDVAGVLKKLGITSSNFLGFSNGGTTCIQLAIRHPDLVKKLVLIAAVFKRSGFIPGFWDVMKGANIDNMPKPLKEAYLAINSDREGLLAMFNRDKNRMLEFSDINDSNIRQISSPALVISGDRDVILAEHSLELSRTLRNSRLLIMPGEHGEYIGEICTLRSESIIPRLAAEFIDEFLRESDHIHTSIDAAYH